jgi:glycosyltransferase involved in cell wall biosynthesis
MEYMALGKAVVAFDLPETRVSGGDFVEYVAGDATRGLADAVLRLADDPERRHEMGRMARLRIEKELAWEHQERYLLSVYRRVLPGESLRG